MLKFFFSIFLIVSFSSNSYGNVSYSLDISFNRILDDLKKINKTDIEGMECEDETSLAIKSIIKNLEKELKRKLDSDDLSSFTQCLELNLREKDKWPQNGFLVGKKFQCTFGRSSLSFKIDGQGNPYLFFKLKDVQGGFKKGNKLIALLESSNNEYISLRLKRELRGVEKAKEEMLAEMVISQQLEGKEKPESVLIPKDTEEYELLVKMYQEDLNSFSLKKNSIEDDEKLVKDLIEGLEYMHERGVYHRDIKPSNIVGKRDEKNVLQVGYIDYNLAVTKNEEGRVVNPLDDEEASHTAGTPPYMEPWIFHSLVQSHSQKEEEVQTLEDSYESADLTKVSWENIYDKKSNSASSSRERRTSSEGSSNRSNGDLENEENKSSRDTIYKKIDKYALGLTLVSLANRRDDESFTAEEFSLQDYCYEDDYDNYLLCLKDEASFYQKSDNVLLKKGGELMMSLLKDY